MAATLGGRILVTPSAACVVAESSTEPMQNERSKGLTGFTKKQQRTVKLLLLRASRPLLKQSKVAIRMAEPALDMVHLRNLEDDASPAAAPADMEVAVGSDPLPLHALRAFEEARRAKQYESIGSSPLDWMLDLAQGVSLPQYDWPKLGWSKESDKGKAAVIQAPEGFLDASPLAFRELSDEDVVEEDVLDVEEDEEEDVAETSDDVEADGQASVEMMYPRCQWPRSTSGASATTSLPSASSLSSPYPRCSWPRENARSPLRQSAVQAVGSPVLAEPADVEPAAQAADASAALAYPRCAWPRSSQGVVRPAPEAEPELGTPSKEDIELLERVFAAEPNVGVPHCAWPRKASIPGQTQAAGTPMGAHCAWPRKGALSTADPAPEQVLGPRCAWPRASALSSAAAGSVSGLAHEAEDQIAPATAFGARCAWPRVARPTPNAASRSSSTELSALGPRCEWPKPGSQMSPAVLVSEPKVLEGARCAWPKAGGNGAAAAPLGARCAWPRSVEAVTSEAPVAPAVQAAEGARCGWPKAGGASGNGAARKEGPRCAWPKQGENLSSA